MQLYFSADALFWGIDDATIKRLRVNVQCNGPLIEFARVDDAMHGFLGINGAWVNPVHLHRGGGFEIAMAGVQVLRNKMIIFHEQATDGGSHPAILPAMVVN